MKADLHDMEAGKAIYPADPEAGNAPVKSDGDVSTLLVANVMNQLMRPILESIGTMLKNNTAALEQLSAAQSVQNDRMEALEKQIRLQTKVDGKMAGYLNEAIRGRSRELLDKRGISEKKAVTKLGNAIRKAVLMRYGISSLRDVPKHEYNVALNLIGMWNDVLTVRDVVNEARGRMEAGNEQRTDF